MGRKPQMSTTCLIGGIVITLLGTTVLGVSVQRTEFKEDQKNGSQMVNGGHISAVYTSVRYSTSRGNPIKTVEEAEQPTTISDSTLLPSEIVQVTEGLNIPKSGKQSRVLPTSSSTSTPEASLHPINISSATLPIRSLLEQEDASSKLQEETQTESTSSPSTTEPLLTTASVSTSIFPQLNRNAADDGSTENRGETDRISEIETHLIANKEEMRLSSSSEVEYTEKKPDDLSAQATALHSRFEPEGDSLIQPQYRREGESQTVAVLENKDETLTNPSSIAEKTELYAIPKEATDIIALNAQLLGYNIDGYQDVAEWHSPKHNATALRDNEQEITTLEDVIEITTTPPIDTTTHKRTYRRRRRRRKGQSSQSSRRLQTNESYQGGEEANVETLTNIPSTEAIEHEGVTHQPLPPARSRYGMRKVKYTVRTTTEDYGSETLATTESAQDEPNRNVRVPSGRARSQSYRRRRPRYRVKARRRNNQTLVSDENVTWDTEQSKQENNFSVILNPTESTQKNLFQETTENSANQPETEHFAVTTLRTHIIQAINELQQINTYIASRKDDISNNTKNNDLPQPLVLQSRPLMQNSLEANASQYERSFLRNLSLSEQEMAQVVQSLLNRSHARTALNADLLPQQDLYRELFSGTTQNLQRFGNFTKKYKEDFSPVASTIDRNVNSIQQGNHQPNVYVRNNTQDGFSSVYLLKGIPVKELVERDLVTSEQQQQYLRRPANSAANICQNSTIPEIIDCIRNIEQRKSPGRRGSHTEVRKYAATDFPKVAQANDIKIYRSSRNSTVPVNQQNKGSVRNNRNYLSAQVYSKPTDQGISVKSTTQYSTNSSPSNRNRKTISSTPKLGLTNLHSGSGGKPGVSTPSSNKNVNSVSNSLSGALKVGGRMLLSHLQKLGNAILQIPGHLGRLSAEAGNQKQAQKSKSSVPVSVLAPRSSSSFSFTWR